MFRLSDHTKLGWNLNYWVPVRFTHTPQTKSAYHKHDNHFSACAIGPYHHHWPVGPIIRGRRNHFFRQIFQKNFFLKMYCHFSIFLDPLNPNLASIFIIFRFETSIPRYIDIYQVQNYKVFGAIM